VFLEEQSVNLKRSFTMITSKIFRAVLTAVAFVSVSLFSAQSLAAKADNTPSMALTKVSINSANADTLSDILTGVGLKKAQAIVAYREAHGKFKRVEDLALVKGIGEATIEKNKAKLTL